MRIAILDNYDNLCTFIDNDVPGAMHYYDDEFHVYLSGTAYTFSFSFTEDHEDKRFLTVGNKVAFNYKNKSYYLNILNTDKNTVTAYGLSLELTNEDVGPKSGTSLSFEQYIDLFGFESDILKIRVNEVSDKRISYSWDGTETILARLFSLANVFDAEIEFVTELNRNYGLEQITLNIYKKHDDQNQGLGNDKRKEVIRNGQIKFTSKSNDITELYTAIRPIGKDGLTLANINKTEYDANGNIEYYSPAGTIEILAPQARDRFPSNLMYSINDRYIAKEWSYDTDDVNVLYGQSLAQLKKNCIPLVKYDTSGYIDGEIGDTFTIEDTDFKPTLYVEARIIEQVISFTDETKNKTIFDNFTEVNSQIDDSLINEMNELIEKNKNYQAIVSSTNGIVFKNDEESTNLTAVIKDGIKDITDSLKIKWYRDDQFVLQEKTITVLSNSIKDKALYKFEALDNNDEIKASAEITVVKVADGTDGVSVTTIRKYYKLYDKSLGTPNKPSQYPPSADWKSTEPAYIAENNLALYTVDMVLFSNSKFQYSDVSLSSSYAAAEEARKTATNFIWYDNENGLVVGNRYNDKFSGYRAQMLPETFNILDKNGNKMSSYGADLIDLGIQSVNAVIKMCAGLAQIALADEDFFEKTTTEAKNTLKYLQMVSDNIRIRGNERVSIYQSKYDPDINVAYKNGLYMDAHSGIDDPNSPVAQSIHLSSTVIEGIDEETGIGIEKGSHVYLDSDGASMESQHDARVTAIDGNVYLTADGATKDVVVNGVPARRFLKTQTMMVSGTIVVEPNGQRVVGTHSLNGVKQMFKNKYGVDIGNLDPINLAISYTNGDPDASWVSVTGSYIRGDGQLIAALSDGVNGKYRIHYQYLTYVDVYDDSKWDDSILS